MIEQWLLNVNNCEQWLLTTVVDRVQHIVEQCAAKHCNKLLLNFRICYCVSINLLATWLNEVTLQTRHILVVIPVSGYS